MCLNLTSLKLHPRNSRPKLLKSVKTPWAAKKWEAPAMPSAHLTYKDVLLSDLTFRDYGLFEDPGMGR
ncbi:jg15434 [Pararge aegeria aegeria]|uniref:Jg15434 protein n=1 Tax=Pararge aegeria aegeria TaxID=348720 RepID=A0A8S4SCA8_9NEOP|nr:jg15434 [Pararge aegeria aegeria]